MSQPATTRCARCFAPAVDTAVIVMDRQQLEVDLCEDHVRHLLLGARSLDAGPNFHASQQPNGFSLPARPRRLR